MMTCSQAPCPVCKGAAVLFQTVRYGVQKVRCPHCGDMAQNKDGKYESRKLNGRREQRARDRGRYLLLQPLQGRGRTLARVTDKHVKPVTYVAV